MVPTEKPKLEFDEAKLDSMFSRAAKPVLDWLTGPSWLKFIWDSTCYVLSRVMAFVLGQMSYLAAAMAGIIMKAEARSDPAFQRLAEAGIEDLFGVKVDMSSVRGPGGREARTAAANAIGRGILEGLFGQFTGAQADVLKPSSEGAEKFLSTVSQLALEGWLEGWMFEALSLGAMEKFADLDDAMAGILGLGRLSRRVMGPPCDVFITQPFTWKLNQTYRPNLLSPGELIRQYIRGRATRERVFRELAMAGYRDDDIEAILATQQKFLGDADLVYLVDHGIWDDAEAIQHLRDQGFTEDIARCTLALERDRKVDGYRRKAAGAVLDAYVGRDIEEGEVRRQLALLKLPTWEQQWMRQVAGLEREFRTKDLSLSDMEQAVKRGIRSIADYRALCLKQGYSLEDARTLELLLMTEIKDKEAAAAAKAELAAEKAAEAARKAEEQAARRAEIEAEQQVRGVSLGQMEAMVRRDLRSVEQYREFLRGLKYAPADVSALAELLEGQIADARAEAERRKELQAEAARRKVSLAELERAVKLGLMSVDEYRSQLAAAGFGDEDRALVARLLERELDLARENQARKAEAGARLAERKVSLEELERAVRLGLRTVAQYRARLVAEGFGADDADLLTDLLRADVAADGEARERRAEIDAGLKRKKISLSEMEQAVRAGIRTMSDYRTVLLREGYSDADAELLARLLQLQVDADRQAAEKRREAEARLADRRISLSDVERAVKLGVMDLAAYRRVLTREGFTAEDQQILVQMLTAELAEIRAAERKRAAAEKAAAKREISLGELERAVRVGLRTMLEYQGTLADLGYGPQDQLTMMALLQLQVEQDQAARLKREQAETALVQRGLSLSQWERAVREDVRSMAEYVAWLLEQGYGEEDAATLVALLQLELAARA